MEKNWLMAVVMAGFAGMAQASSSVTLYGALDTAVGYERTKQHATGVTQKRTGFFNGIETGNHWGLKGTEDRSHTCEPDLTHSSYLRPFVIVYYSCCTTLNSNNVQIHIYLYTFIHG